MATKRIKDITNTGSEDDLKSENFLALDGPNGSKKIPGDAFTPSGRTASISSSIAPEFDPDRAETYKKGELVMHVGQLRQFTADHPTGPWISGDNKKVDMAALIKESEKMKTFTTFSNIGLGIVIGGNSRAKQTSPSAVHTLALDPISSMVSANAGFKAGQSVKIIGAQLKAGAAFGLQPPAADDTASPAINGKAGVLVVSLFALDSSGDAVGSAISTFTLSVMNWDSWEEKSIELSIPSTVPSGAVGFGLQLATASVFEFDDFNIQGDYINEYVKPELLLQVATDKMVKLSDGSDIN